MDINQTHELRAYSNNNTEHEAQLWAATEQILADLT
jgi:hypothetical protein